MRFRTVDFILFSQEIILFISWQSENISSIPIVSSAEISKHQTNIFKYKIKNININSQYNVNE